MKGKHSKKKRATKKHTHTTSHTHTQTHTHTNTHTHKLMLITALLLEINNTKKNNNLHIHLKWNSQINCWVYTQKILLILKNKQTVFTYTEDGS